MDDLKAKAKASGPDTVRAKDTAGEQFTLLDGALYSADELSADGQYPEFGDWLEIESDTAGQRWLECPEGLAQCLVELLPDDPEWPVTIVVDDVVGGGDQPFRFVVEVVDD